MVYPQGMEEWTKILESIKLEFLTKMGQYPTKGVAGLLTLSPGIEPLGVDSLQSIDVECNSRCSESNTTRILKKKVSIYLHFPLRPRNNRFVSGVTVTKKTFV